MQRNPSKSGEEVGGTATLLSESERAQVHEQMERMLANPLFSQSKRYAPFLRYIVQNALEGHEANLKERLIGIEVLGRATNYDSNNDPSVRVTAGEVRRRIAQYYQDPEHASELRINLYPGSYVPEFSFVSTTVEPVDAATTLHANREGARPKADAIPETVQSRPSPSSLSINAPTLSARKLQLIALAMIVVGLCCFSFLRSHNKGASVAQWWQPALGRSTPVLLCVGMIDNIPVDSSQVGGAESASTVGEYVRHRDHVGLIDVIALERLASMLSSHGQPYRTMSAASTTFADLRGGPVVLVAGLNNPWTMRLTQPLRFHFADAAIGTTNSILDRQSPTTKWTVDFSVPYNQTTKDYAIVARLHDITTDQPIFIVAGLGGNGTSAAAEVLTSDIQLQRVISRLPANWQTMNVEAVIATEVIGNQPGPPSLVALHTW